VLEDGHALELTLVAGADPRALLARLVTAGVGLVRFEVVEPSLQQVFIDRVGTEPIAEGALA
jgi:ABC-2 type transport system ATP-binding protein